MSEAERRAAVMDNLGPHVRPAGGPAGALPRQELGRRAVEPRLLRGLHAPRGVDRVRAGAARADRRDPLGRDGNRDSLERLYRRRASIRRAGGARGARGVPRRRAGQPSALFRPTRDGAAGRVARAPALVEEGGDLVRQPLRPQPQLEQRVGLDQAAVRQLLGEHLGVGERVDASRGCPSTSAGASKVLRSSRGGAVRPKKSPCRIAADGPGVVADPVEEHVRVVAEHARHARSTAAAGPVIGSPKVSETSSGVKAIAHPSRALSRPASRSPCRVRGTAPATRPRGWCWRPARCRRRPPRRSRGGRAAPPPGGRRSASSSATCRGAGRIPVAEQVERDHPVAAVRKLARQRLVHAARQQQPRQQNEVPAALAVSRRRAAGRRARKSAWAGQSVYVACSSASSRSPVGVDSAAPGAPGTRMACRGTLREGLRTDRAEARRAPRRARARGCQEARRTGVSRCSWSAAPGRRRLCPTGSTRRPARTLGTSTTRGRRRGGAKAAPRSPRRRRDPAPA